MKFRIKHIVKLLISIIICSTLICTPINAENIAINYNLLANWAMQPPKVQQYLVLHNTRINVVDMLPWTSTALYDTYGYTTMNIIPDTPYVASMNIFIKTGCESSLTHEIGHCLSNANDNFVYGRCYTPEFMEIWVAEKDKNPVMMPQGITDIREYFAESYDMYIRFPQILQTLNPRTFIYMANTIATL